MTRLFWHTQLLLIGLPFVLLGGCTAAIDTRKMPPCAASHVFAWPTRQLHDAIPALFRAEDSRQDDDPALSQQFMTYAAAGNADTLRLQAYFMAETADSALFGKDYFTRATRQNIYLHCFGDYWNSPTYYAAGEPLPYTTAFAIALDSLGPRQTKATVNTLHPHVFHGYGGVGGICGLTLRQQEVPVPASGPEECALLAYLVKQLPAPAYSVTPIPGPNSKNGVPLVSR